MSANNKEYFDKASSELKKVMSVDKSEITYGPMSIDDVPIPEGISSSVKYGIDLRFFATVDYEKMTAICSLPHGSRQNDQGFSVTGYKTPAEAMEAAINYINSEIGENGYGWHRGSEGVADIYNKDGVPLFRMSLDFEYEKEIAPEEKPVEAAKIRTVVNRDNIWCVDIASKEATVGIEFEDTNDEGDMFQVANHASLEDAIKHIKDWSGGEEAYNKGLACKAFGYTDDLIAEYPDEVKKLGWFNFDRYHEADTFCYDLVDRPKEFDIYEDKAVLNSLIEDTASLYEYKRNGSWDLLVMPDIGEHALAERLTEEAYNFDHYDTVDAFDSREDAYNEMRRSLNDVYQIKDIHAGLCQHYEEIWEEASPYANRIKEIDAKYSKNTSVNRNKSVDAEFGSISSEASIDMEKDD